MNKTLLIDNFDSFVQNVAHLVRATTDIQITVCDNRSIPFNDLNLFSHIIISPGPGVPSESMDLFRLIEMSMHSHKILGICLGHQTIGEFFGAQLINLNRPYHGHSSSLVIQDHNDPLFRNIMESQKIIGLYHSWALELNSISDPLIISSVNEDNIPMSIRHKSLPIYGIQFHPESIISKCGKTIISNFYL